MHPMDIEDQQDDIEYECEYISEINYVEAMFGVNAKLTYEDWTEKSNQIERVYKIFYEAQNLRSLVFTRVGIPFDESA